MAHGRIVAVDTALARAMPGIAAVWTAADIADVPPIDFREGRNAALEPYRQPVLATERVRYVGEPVAAVFAKDPYLAEDAADRVAVTVETLPVLLDAAADPGEFSPGHGTEAALVRQGYGDIDAAMARAYAIVSLDLAVGRHTGVPIETRGAIGRYDAARDILELHGAAKVPHRIRDLLALMLGRAPSAIHVHESDVGGGFGVRGELYPEDVLVCVAALRLGRPVKWIEDRREHFVAANHSRQQRHVVRAAVAADGTILAIDDEFWHDQGAYVRTHGTRVAMMATGILPGPYRVPAYRSVCHFRLTNKTPAATYRAPGRYETTFVRERLIEAIAHTLKLNSITVRRRNAITAAEMPFHRPLQVLGEDVRHDTGDYMGLLDKVLAHASWDTLQAQLRERRRNGELVGARRRDVRGEERARAGGWRDDRGGCERNGRGRHRRSVDRPGLRDRDRPGGGGGARSRLPERPGGPRPDRPHGLRHRRPCVARDRHDGLGDPRGRVKAARQGARYGGAAVAGRAGGA